MKLESIKKSRITETIREILALNLYVEGWQAFDFFTYILENPKPTIQNSKSKDFQLKSLAVAKFENMIVAWVAKVEFVEQEVGFPIIWKFTNPKYREQGILTKLKTLTEKDSTHEEENCEENQKSKYQEKDEKKS